MIEGVTTVLAAVLVYRAATWATPHRTQAWADRRGLALDESGLERLRQALTTTRICRTVGMLAGVVVAMAGFPLLFGLYGGIHHDLLFAVQHLLSVPPVVVFGMLGYAAGIAVAQATHLEWPNAHRRARLVARTAASYGTSSGRWLLLGAGGVLAIAVAGHHLAQAAEVRAGTTVTADGLVITSLSGDVTLAGLVIRPLLAAVAVVALEAVRQWVVRRPQRARSDGEAAADDAVRVADVQILSGLQIALVLIAASGSLRQATTAAPVGGTWWFVVLHIAAIGCMAAAAAAVIRFGPGTAFTGGAGHGAAHAKDQDLSPPTVRPLAAHDQSTQPAKPDPPGQPSTPSAGAVVPPPPR